MELTVTIQMDNAAFDDHPQVEVAAILRDLTARVEAYAHLAPGVDLSLYDSNGNWVGNAIVTGA